MDEIQKEQDFFCLCGLLQNNITVSSLVSANIGGDKLVGLNSHNHCCCLLFVTLGCSAVAVVSSFIRNLKLNCIKSFFIMASSALWELNSASAVVTRDVKRACCFRNTKWLKALWAAKLSIRLFYAEQSQIVFWNKVLHCQKGDCSHGVHSVVMGVT